MKFVSKVGQDRQISTKCGTNEQNRPKSGAKPSYLSQNLGITNKLAQKRE